MEKLIPKLLPKFAKGYAFKKPCRDSLLSWFTGQVNADKTGYISRTGTDDRQVLPAGSMKFDGSAYGDLASDVVLSGDFWMELAVDLSSVIGQIFFSASDSSSTFKLSSTGTFNTSIGNSWGGGTYVVPTGKHVLKIARSGSTLNCYVDELLVDSYTVLTADFVVRMFSKATGRLTGYAWGLKAGDSSGTKLHIPGVTGAGTIAANVIDPDNPLTIYSQPSDFWYSHSDGGGSDYLNEYGYSEADGATMYTTSSATTLYTSGAKIPAVSGSTEYCCAFDSPGNPIVLSHSGKVKPTLDCYKAPAFVGNGVASGSVSNFSVTGVVEVEVEWKPSQLEHQGILSLFCPSGVCLKYRDNGDLWVRMFTATVTKTLYYGGFYTAGERHTIKVTRAVDGAITVYKNGVVFPLSSSNLSGLISLPNTLYVAAYDPLGTYTEEAYGELYSINIKEDGVTKASYSFTEGSLTETAMMVYDRVGNNHITLSNMSATNWQLVERPDWPLLDGFSKDTTGYIPASTVNTDKDSAGNDLEYLPDKTMVTVNPTQLRAPLYKPHINQEKDIGVNLWFDGAGGQNALTLSDLTANWNDANFYSTNKYLVYEAAITGSCKTKTENYMAAG